MYTYILLSKLINFSILLFFIFYSIYLSMYTPSNQHFKAFPLSKISSETSFLYQLFNENSNFIVLKPCKVIYFSIYYFYYLYIYLGMYTPSNHHFKAFPVSKINSETSFLYQLFKGNLNIILLKPCKVIIRSIFFLSFCIYLYIHIYILYICTHTYYCPNL